MFEKKCGEIPAGKNSRGKDLAGKRPSGEKELAGKRPAGKRPKIILLIFRFTHPAYLKS